MSKFNKTLAEKVARANRYEKQNDLQNAIKAWMEISEMALKATKEPRLESSYRNMLIIKTQQIIDHIKSLKVKMTEPIRKEKVIEALTPKKKVTGKQESVEIPKEVETQPKITNDLNVSINEQVKPETKALSEINIVDNSEFKNIPEGFKPIKPPEKFKIVTPHDENHVKKVMSQTIDMDIFRPQKESEPESQESNHNKIGQVPARIELEQPKDGSKKICFACGAELPPNSKICSNCGSNLA